MRTSAVLAAAIAAAALPLGPARADEAESLLIPGIDVRTVEFKLGAWCRYRVIDEAMGVADTSVVTFAIVGKESTPAGPAYWLEIESAPTGTKDPPEYSRALVEERIRTMAAGDSLYHYVRRVYTKRGSGPVERGNPKDLKRLTVVSPASEKDWRVTRGQKVNTAAGEIECEQRQFEKTESRDVPSGRITIRQRRDDRVQVWVSPRIPVFHLVRCEIERVRESHAVPPVRGVPDAGARRSRTVTEIIAHGAGAKAKVKVPKGRRSGARAR